MIREREEEIRQSATETEEDPFDGYGHRSFPEEGEGGSGGRGRNKRARGREARTEKFETPGVEMLSGMQERTILIKESARSLRRGRPRAVQHARAISTRVPAWPPRCAECRRQARRGDR